jgi:hypothetical protein
MVLMKYFSLILLSIFIWSCNESQPTAPKEINAKDIFTTRCAACHGMDGKMSVGGSKPLHTSALTDEEILYLVDNGSIPPYALEKKLEDFTRAVSIRRKLICTLC